MRSWSWPAWPPPSNHWYRPSSRRPGAPPAGDPGGQSPTLLEILHISRVFPAQMSELGCEMSSKVGSWAALGWGEGGLGLQEEGHGAVVDQMYLHVCTEPTGLDCRAAAAQLGDHLVHQRL